MIQLIRRFLNSENTPLNRILRTGLEEVSNKVGESDGKTLFDVVGSLNTNPNNPLNTLIETWGNTLKSLINSYRPWYPTYGTTVTLKSTTTQTSLVVADSGNYESNFTKIFTFVAPKTGHYRLDVAAKVTSTHTSGQNQYANIQCRLAKNPSASKSMDLLGSSDTSTASNSSQTLSPSVETTLTPMTADLFLEEGKSYNLAVGIYASYDDKCTGKLTSASIKYVKTAGVTY